MFKHILLPTDGSPLSEATINKGVEFAKGIGARITGLYVMPQFHMLPYGTEMIEDARASFAQDLRAHADRYLAYIDRKATSAGVICDVGVAASDHPHEAIIKAASDHHCDIIMMASHGRRGVQGLLIGSETQKVLTYSKIPVLVYR